MMFIQKIKNSTFLTLLSVTAVVDCLFISTFSEEQQKQQQQRYISNNNNNNNIENENDATVTAVSPQKDFLHSGVTENRKFQFKGKSENENIFAKNSKYDENLWNFSSHSKKVNFLDRRHEVKNGNFDNFLFANNTDENENGREEDEQEKKGREHFYFTKSHHDDPIKKKNLFDADDDILVASDDESTQNLFEYMPVNVAKRQMLSAHQHQYQQQQQQHHHHLHNQQQQQQQLMAQSTVFSRRHVVDKLMYTNEINIKQGRVKGIIRSMHPQSGLKDVDQFLGLPYAEAPVGSKRFMPPGAPLPWHGIKIASHLPPVCPQNLPENGKANVKLSKGRYDQLVRLLAYLKNESEDCLYLNVYVPRKDGLEKVQKFPVIVYVHGESYEWNSGNPYDGSVLASYGQVIVVTINYRLGILGFLKPGISEHTVTNFGLLDQIAALQWVKDNIELFGGDSNSVTLMGHGTGAACVNFLMVSPVAKGLFHRAILMSGSAMSDWAMSNYSLQLTMQVAHGLNCPLSDDDDELLNCLRKRRYQEIVKVPKSYPKFSTAFGPIVDGLVIPNQPYKVMEQYTDLFSRYDLLFGVTEVESYHMLSAVALEEGLRENERDSLLRSYLQHRFEIRPDLALAATLNKYTDIYNNPTKASSHEHRDVVLDILSDARVVGPVVQTGVFHAKVNPRSYMYVFGHNSEAGAHAHLPHSIIGEELAFVFGAPLAPAGPFPLRYSMQEKLLSEAVMQYWTNFAKTGNPKAPWREQFVNLHPLEWERYDIDWPEFNSKNQCFVNIGIPPSLGYRYREIYMKFWNKELPQELNEISMAQPSPFIHFFPSSPTQVPRTGTSINTDEIIPGHLNKYPSVQKNIRNKEDSLKTLKLLLQDPLEKADNMYNAQPTSKVVKSSTDVNDFKILLAKTDVEKDEDSEKTLHILIGVVVVVLVLNAIIGMIYFIRKKKRNMTMNQKLGILSYDGTTDDDLKKCKNNDGDDSYILDIVRRTSKTSRLSPINGFKITRHMSASTVDAHVKVADWMSQDMVDFGSKSSKTSTPSFSFKRRSFLKKPKKVNVAIDATPKTRSNSILQQEPIEVTKLKSCDSPKIICQDVEIAEELLNPDESDSISIERRQSSSSSVLKESNHQDSVFSPSDSFYSVSTTNDEQVTSFISGDINVTSRDEDSIEKDPLSPEEQLQNIKRRNFPKVLPDYPAEENCMWSMSVKRKSLPLPSLISSFSSCKTPPMPPPRTISTLGRQPSNRRHSNSITTSPLMLAKDYPEEEEPKISENTLIVGPLLPRSQESIYCTISQKKRSVEDCHEKNEIGQKQQPQTVAVVAESRPSGIRPPQLSSFHSVPPPSPPPPLAPISKKNTPATKQLASVHRVFPIKDYGSKIPQLKLPPTKTSDGDGGGQNERDKSTPDSSSSDTNSSIVTVKTDLKQK